MSMVSDDIRENDRIPCGERYPQRLPDSVSRASLGILLSMGAAKSRNVSEILRFGTELRMCFAIGFVNTLNAIVGWRPSIRRVQGKAPIWIPLFHPMSK
jgi:hypothetical protein